MARGKDNLCDVCRALSLEKMRGPDRDRMQQHHRNALALKRSVELGCQLCRFIWDALGQDVSIDGESGATALEHVSERYPGRQLVLVAWGDGPDSWLDRIRIISHEEDIPEEEFVDYVDTKLHPDHQFTLSGELEIYAHSGMRF